MANSCGSNARWTVWMRMTLAKLSWSSEADLLGQYGETWQGDLPREIELRFVGGMISIKVEARVLAEHSVSRWIMAHRGWILEISLVEVDEESLGLAVAGGLLARVPTLRLRFDSDSNDGLKDIGLGYLMALFDSRG